MLCHTDHYNIHVVKRRHRSFKLFQMHQSRTIVPSHIIAIEIPAREKLEHVHNQSHLISHVIFIDSILAYILRYFTTEKMKLPG